MSPATLLLCSDFPRFQEADTVCLGHICTPETRMPWGGCRGGGMVVGHLLELLHHGHGADTCSRPPVTLNQCKVCDLHRTIFMLATCRKVSLIPLLQRGVPRPRLEPRVGVFKCWWGRDKTSIVLQCRDWKIKVGLMWGRWMVEMRGSQRVRKLEMT